MRTAILVLVFVLIGAGCSPDRESRRRRSAAEGPLTDLPPAARPEDKVVCVRAEAATFDSGSVQELLTALSLAGGTVRDPGSKNGLVVYHGGPEFAVALAKVFKAGAERHPAQLLTMRVFHTATLRMGAGPGGAFRFWGEWRGRMQDGQEVRAMPCLRRVRIRAEYRSDEEIDLRLTPVIASPEPEAAPTELSSLSIRVTVATGGVALVGAVEEGTFGSWFLTRESDAGVDRFFLVLHVHCLN